MKEIYTAIAILKQIIKTMKNDKSTFKRNIIKTAVTLFSNID